ncbi:uncharacterized protein LOC131671023 [Phymastichus coffea]|uniref:uncharacterized protein LOC131671023 n=1 Tax=Phymastichus coffea TaxID=108790 RepID=UPI00273C9820|nr:uncharacterized protein LOC131671023 [Phymastichus coffea]
MSSVTQLRAIVCVAALLGGARADQEVGLPRSVKVCNHQAPDYSSCLRLAIQESWMTFVKGIPELGLPVLDPMEVDMMENEFHMGQLMGRFVLRDVKSYGAAKSIFQAVRPTRSADRMSLEVDFVMPKVFIEGDYKAEGSVGPYKIGGKGYFNISMEGVSTTWGIEGRVENDRWVVEHFHVYPEVEKMKVYFTDLFNGNPELNKAAMTFVNEYWQVLYKGMLPVVERHWDVHLTDFVNRLIFSKVSFAKTFP